MFQFLHLNVYLIYYENFETKFKVIYSNHQNYKTLMLFINNP